MRYRSRAFLVAAFTGLMVLGLATAALGAETASSELVIVAEDDVISDDLYAVGNRVIIDGIVDGDLVAFAVEEVEIKGEVTGSVFALTPMVRVEGHIGGSLRASGDSIVLDGSVGRDIVVAGLTVDLGGNSRVESDVLIWAFATGASGSIGGTLSGTQRSLELEGEVEGDVDVTVSRLTITGALEVGGDLGYRSEDDAEGLDKATVGGATVHKMPQPPNIRVRALGMLARILIALGLAAMAVLVAWAWPQRTARAADVARESFLRAYGWGALVVLSPVIIAAVAGLFVALAPASASLPLLAIFAPVILALLGIVLVLSLIAGVPAVLLLGRLLRKDLSVYGALALGSAVVGFVWLFPLVGWIVPLLVLPLGMGAWILMWRRPAEDESATLA